MIVLVTGGRDYNNKEAVYAALDEYHSIFPISLLVAGGAKGADYLAMLWAEDRGISSVEYFPEWGKYGKAAGIIRNQEMLEDSNAETVIAFPGGTGTYDMIKRAKQKPGVDLVVINDVDSTS